MSGVDACPEHSERTRSERHWRYCFSIKHHGGPRNAAQWKISELSREDEFAIFDEADWHEISDDDGNLYGLRRDAELNLLDLGTEREQIAKFWNPEKNQPTHGFPLWPLAESGPDNRRKQSAPKDALSKMRQAGLLIEAQYNRLMRGKYA